MLKQDSKSTTIQYKETFLVSVILECRFFFSRLFSISLEGLLREMSKITMEEKKHTHHARQLFTELL